MKGDDGGFCGMKKCKGVANIAIKTDGIFIVRFLLSESFFEGGNGDV